MSTTNTSSKGPHVAVLAFPFSTHAAPLLSIVRRLAVAAPHVIFSFLSTSQSNNFIFSSTTTSNNLKAYDVWDGVPEGYVFKGKPQEDIELFMRAAPESFRSVIEVAAEETGRPVSCLVVDAFFWFAPEMAEEMEVEFVPFWTAGPGSLSAHVYTDLIRETIGVEGITGKEEEFLKFVPGMSRLRVRDLPEGIVFGNLESLFSCMLHKMGQMLPNAAAVFINSFEELDLAITNDLKAKFEKFLNIGPLNLTSPPPQSKVPDQCLLWLNEQKPRSVAYISFGSVTIPPPHELIALAEALEASDGVLTKKGVIKKLDQVLTSEHGKKMREKIKDLKGLAEKAVGPKGSSTQNFNAFVDIISKPKQP
ncbi:hypothetical protein RJ641_007864 [Dillenia turbinata]|uniref:Uncharacterized protein n=1 Tax=Dillenia turbinata TaxID=194707 RepID=A0AAN8Z8D2_9MAGN